MKKVLSILLLLCMVFSVIACQKKEDLIATVVSELGIESETESETESSTQSESSNQNAVELDINNYTEFLTFTSETAVKEGRILKNFKNTVTGALPYAYYENVVVTFDVTYNTSQGVHQGEFSVNLNAAGGIQFFGDDEALLNSIGCTVPIYSINSRSYTIKNVSGKVILNP